MLGSIYLEGLGMHLVQLGHLLLGVGFCGFQNVLQMFVGLI